MIELLAWANANNIPLLFSAIAILLSIINFVIWLYAHRVCLILRIEEGYKLTLGERKLMHIRVVIENKSQLPIAITQLRLCQHDGSFVDASFEPEFVKEKMRTFADGGKDSFVIRTTAIPINIQGLGAVGGWHQFLEPPFNPLKQGTNLRFELRTNRGRVIRKITLANDLNNL